MLVLAAGILYYFINRGRSNQAPKVVYQSDQGEETIEDRLANIPKDGQSDVCDRISKESLTKKLHDEFASARPSIATTKTSEGTVSACTYIAKPNKKSVAQYVVVTVRDYTEPNRAKKSFDILLQAKSNNNNLYGPDVLYNQSVAQVTKRGERSLMTIVVQRVNETRPLPKEYVKALTVL